MQRARGDIPEPAKPQAREVRSQSTHSNIHVHKVLQIHPGFRVFNAFLHYFI